MFKNGIMWAGKKWSFFKIFELGIIFFMFIGSIDIHKDDLINDIYNIKFELK